MSKSRHPSIQLVTLLALVITSGAAVAGRPPAALESERRALDLEIDLLRKKNEALARTAAERRVQARQRLRTLYKLSQGGFVRLLLGAETPVDFYIRKNAFARIVARDLVEVAALGTELRELVQDRERLRERERRAFELENAPDWFDGGFPARPAGLVRPVAGPVIHPFGPTRDSQRGLAATRDGITLRATPGEPVRALAPGQVRSVGPVADLGLAVIIDHGGGWTSLTAGITEADVHPGQFIGAGLPIARAGAAVELQLMQSGAWVDAAPWLMPAQANAPAPFRR